MRSTTLLVAGLLLVATVGPVAGQTETATPTEQCSTDVYYDAFRTDQSVINATNDSGSTSVSKQNTRVTVNETEAFYRLRAENPNSYCVDMTVDIADAVLPAATLGEVESVDGETTAHWTDVTDFDSQSAYTEVSFTVPANTTVTFAPSRPTVFFPAWRDQRKRGAEGLLDRVTGLSPFGDDEAEADLSKRTYYFNASESETVTVRLDNPNASDQRIEEWNAVYRLSEDDPWRPVDTDTADPVYYSTPSEDKVRFVMTDSNAQIEFTANPTYTDEALAEYRSYKRSWLDLGSLFPGLAVSPQVVLR
ncbi:hypothetical protein NDI85_20065 [Halomicroarcula sp. S1AR25-4]|uniref:hypothetical protein n=1 Tax=Haloarcula sp. S1AR25-4 TaxID=2950538 RepID=UPI002875D608|nr:hypothetical protein [Halomicroarcula sp. S1AR25-4]MDS0280085.1 hypothetical protein [Halomicroarcula sp. S1AR25-4]